MKTAKLVAKAWTFKSSSGRGSYETLLYTDGSTSCDCPGWTRRVDAKGDRSCKHTRAVHMGVADRHAIGTMDYVEASNPYPYSPAQLQKMQEEPQPKPEPKTISLIGKRKLA